MPGQPLIYTAKLMQLACLFIHSTIIKDRACPASMLGASAWVCPGPVEAPALAVAVALVSARAAAWASV